LNPTYNDLAVHYGVGILPARPYHARDKPKVEAGVQVVQRWVLAALRKRQFFSLAELNEAIGELTGKLNRRPFRKLPGTREELYRSIDLPVLRPLPAPPYVFAEWKRARIGPKRIRSIWNGRLPASSNGRQRSDRLRRNWRKGSWPKSRIRSRDIAPAWV
jgi:hypothetical protein